MQKACLIWLGYGTYGQSAHISYGLWDVAGSEWKIYYCTSHSLSIWKQFQSDPQQTNAFQKFWRTKKNEGFPWHGGIIQNFTILVLKPHGDLGIPALTIRARCLLGQGMKPLNQSLAICSVYKTIGVLHENKSICYISIYIYIRNIL